MITIQYQVNYLMFLRTDHFLYSIQVFDRVFNKNVFKNWSGHFLYSIQVFGRVFNKNE